MLIPFLIPFIITLVKFLQLKRLEILIFLNRYLTIIPNWVSIRAFIFPMPLKPIENPFFKYCKPLRVTSPFNALYSFSPAITTPHWKLYVFLFLFIIFHFRIYIFFFNNQFSFICLFVFCINTHQWFPTFYILLKHDTLFFFLKLVCLQSYKLFHPYPYNFSPAHLTIFFISLFHFAK